MTVDALREEITALDLQLLETINTRIATVAELRRYKEEHGLAFFDPDRERSLLEQIKAANHGPLSETGVEELVAFVLDLVKREVVDA
jgi:3-deoxy-7-phosphoheptulonate synthase/chorismate mutase